MLCSEWSSMLLLSMVQQHQAHMRVSTAAVTVTCLLQRYCHAGPDSARGSAGFYQQHGSTVKSVASMGVTVPLEHSGDLQSMPLIDLVLPCTAHATSISGMGILASAWLGCL
jgi:hypothetical protein